MKRPTKAQALAGPSQRQLRTGELVRHGLVEVLREDELNDPVLNGVSVTVAEARMTADLKQATVFVVRLGGEDSDVVVEALNRHAKYIRGLLARRVDLRFTPELRFRRDQSFEAAARMDALFANPTVRRDLEDPDADGTT
jgi:ribosome-binding factor A